MPGNAVEERANGRVGRLRRLIVETPELEADRGVRPANLVKTLSVLTVFYAVAAVLATWPFVLSFKDTLTANGDPSQHLWIMNWNKNCVLQGKSPFFCPDLHYPVGAPLGLFSPLHLQSALFIPLSLLTHNDILSYNIIWLIGLVTTGLGVFALAWQVTGNRSASAIGGLLAMLSAPVMLHAHAHLELHFIGTIALFVASWLKLLNRPSGKTFAATVFCFALMAASAAYFVVLMVVPTIWITAWRLVQLTRQEGKPALFQRMKWLSGFGFAALPIVVLLLSNQVWALTHGAVMTRSRAEFTSVFSSAPLWGYFTPTAYHFLSPYLMPFDAYSAAGNTAGTACGYFVIERASYLGVVTLLLIHYGLIHRGSLRQVSIWWSLLVVLVVLGMGAYARIGSEKVSLPALWAWKTFFPFRLIRTPARFNLLVVIPAAILAAAALAHLLERIRRPTTRWSVVAVLSIVAIFDMGLTPYRDTYRLPPLPASYEWLRQQGPEARLFEWPINGPGMADRTYWQLFHGCPTSDGYSGVTNMAFIDRINLLSPLFATSREDFLSKSDVESFGPIRDVRFDDYLWLFLKANNYRFLVLHDDLGPALGHPAALARIRDRLSGSGVFKDATTSIFDLSRMPKPAHDVVVCTDGWRSSVEMPAPLRFGVGMNAGLVLYHTKSDEPVVIELEASSCRTARTVRLLDGPTELARWTIEPGEPRTYLSPSLRFPEGLNNLRLESDAEQKPTRSRDALDESKKPFSLRIQSIRVRNRQ